VQAQDSFLVPCAGRDRRDVERGSIGCEKRLRRADGIQLLEYLALEIEFFRRRFDDQSRSVAVFQACRHVKTIERFLLLLRSNPAAFPAAFQKTLHTSQTGIDEFLLDVVNNRFESRLGGDLRDPSAHGAGAEDGDFFGFVSHDNL
jgi:hypothetical protein